MVCPLINMFNVALTNFQSCRYDVSSETAYSDVYQIGINRAFGRARIKPKHV